MYWWGGVLCIIALVAAYIAVARMRRKLWRVRDQLRATRHHLGIAMDRVHCYRALHTAIMMAPGDPKTQLLTCRAVLMHYEAIQDQLDLDMGKYYEDDSSVKWTPGRW